MSRGNGIMELHTSGFLEKVEWCLRQWKVCCKVGGNDPKISKQEYGKWFLDVKCGLFGGSGDHYLIGCLSIRVDLLCFMIILKFWLCSCAQNLFFFFFWDKQPKIVLIKTKLSTPEVYSGRNTITLSNYCAQNHMVYVVS